MPYALNSPTPAPAWFDSVAAHDALADVGQVARVAVDAPAIAIAPVGPALGQREAQVVLDAALAAIGRKNPKLRYVVFDLSDVRTMSACGLGLCSDLAKRARETGLEPVLFGASNAILDGLRLFRTERLYRVVRSRDDLVVLLHG